MNRLSEALDAYQTAMHDHPEDVVAKNGCASILGMMEKWDEALALLPESTPVTLVDWIGYHIRGMILLRMGSIDAAVRIFDKGVREDPRPTSSDYFRTALAVAQLRLEQYQSACATLDSVTSSETRLYADVLRVHALGEMHSDTTGEAYQKIPGELPPVIIELRNELGRRYVTGEPPQHNTEWLYDRECLMLMAA